MGRRIWQTKGEYITLRGPVQLKGWRTRGVEGKDSHNAPPNSGLRERSLLNEVSVAQMLGQLPPGSRSRAELHRGQGIVFRPQPVPAPSLVKHGLAAPISSSLL